METLLIKILATWRLTHMLFNEDGPYDLVPRFKHFAGVRTDPEGRKYGLNEAGNALTCPYCTSLWVGLLFTFLPVKIAYPFALSAAYFFLKKNYGKG
jgi:hypothetical protein